MKAFSILFTFIFASSWGWAALLTPEGQGQKVEQITLSTAATTNIGGENLKLTSVGGGLRAKKVVFVNVKVYVGQLYVSSPEKFVKNDAGALVSLKDQKAVAIQLHFLRSVDAENVQKSFKEALAANSVNVEDASVHEFLSAVAKGGEAKEGKSLTVLGTKLPDGSERVSYETTSGQVTDIKGSAGFIEKVFSIWLGKPADDGVAQLKKSILK